MIFPGLFRFLNKPGALNKARLSKSGFRRAKLATLVGPRENEGSDQQCFAGRQNECIIAFFPVYK